MNRLYKKSTLMNLLILPVSTMVAINFAQANPNYATEALKSASKIDSEAMKSADDLPKMSSLENNSELVMTLPKIEHFETANGVPVNFVYGKALPIVDAEIRFKAGSSHDSEIRKDGYGIANMVSTMLTQGTDKLNEDDFNREVEQLGVWLSSDVHKDSFSVSLRSLSDDAHLLPAIELMSQTLSLPTFDITVLERNKARLLVALKQQQQNPATTASKRFYKELYGNHPYAYPTSGTLASVPKITQDDLTKFHQQFIVASNASISITGDLTLGEAKRLAQKITVKLDQGQLAKAITEPMPLKRRKVVHVPFDSTQTSVVMGQLGTKRTNDPSKWQQNMDFSIANHVLAGGGFNARLMKEVRKKRGLTYGIYGQMTPMLSKGNYQISFATRNDKLDEAVSTTLDMIKTAQADGLTQPEINLTKNQLVNRFPMSFDSNARINDLLSMMAFYNLPDSYLTGYLNRIRSAKTSEINNSLTTLYPDKFLIVTVGKNVRKGSL